MQIKNFVIQKIRVQLNLKIQRETYAKKNWKIYDFLIYFFCVIYIFNKIALKTELLRLYHNDFFVEHFDTKKTKDFFSKKYYWLKITIDVNEYVKNYNMC